MLEVHNTLVSRDNYEISKMVHVDGTHMTFKATLDSAFTSGLLVDRIMIEDRPLFLVVLANIVVFLHVIVPPNILSIGRRNIEITGCLSPC